MAPQFFEDKNKEVGQNAFEFIPDKLYFTSVSTQLSVDNYSDTHFFTIDHILVYVNFYADFGPNNISHVFKFIDILGQKMKTTNKSICLVTSSDADKRVNGAYLMCFYMMLVYKLTPQEACAPLQNAISSFAPYRDAGYGGATFHINLKDCMEGFYKALQVGLFHVDTFRAEEYEFYEKVENGDFNWLSDKFIAICSPKDDQPNQPLFQVPKKAKLFPVTRIDGLVKYCKENDVRTLVRLNNKLYDKAKFTSAGIQHIEMYFPDGTNPPDAILADFLELCETSTGSIAVHCKAGLGRTGSLIACFMMKHHRFTASEIISFLRIMRPGSVVGPQQNWCQAMQATMWQVTPRTKLAQEFSLVKPSTLNTYTRFQKYADCYPLPRKMNCIPQVNDDMDVDVEIAVERKMKPKSANLSSHFRVMKSNASSLVSKQFGDKNQMAIPIQPRKGHDSAFVEGDAEEPIGQDFSSDHRYADYAVAAKNAKSVDFGSSERFQQKAPSTSGNGVSGKKTNA